jgi:predicted dienelactone hydrolase
VFSHGFTSTYRNGRHFAEYLASHGFVVAAVDYPLTAMGAPGGPNVEDVGSQPADVSFLINAVSAQGEDPGHPLYGIVDAERIGVFGISLGGLTSTLVGFHPQWRDPRIDAVISIAGPTEFFEETFFREAALPFLMLAGDLDVLVPHEYNAAPVPEKVPGGELVTIAGGSHTGFSAGTAMLRWMDNTDAIGCWSVQSSIDPGAQAGWDGLLGDESLGIDYSAPDRLCQVDPLPPAMNVLRQQMISKLVVRAFFERELAAEPARRASAAGFLAETLPAELAEVSYVGGQLPGA